MEDSLNSYLEEITAYSLLISAPKSSVTLFTPDTHQAKTNPRILIEDSRLPLVQCPKILEFHMDTSLSFNTHSSHVSKIISGRNNILKALAGWYILGTTERNLTNDIQGDWEIDHTLCSTRLENKPTRHQLQKYPIHAKWGSEDIHRMSQNVDHLHAEANMLKVKEHSELLSAQYLARCLEPESVNFSITTREPPKGIMKETLFTRHRSNVELLMIAKDRKTTLQVIHTMAVDQAVTSLRRNVVLDDRPQQSTFLKRNLPGRNARPSPNSDPDIVDSLAPTRAESVRMLASTYAPTAAKHHMMLSISSIAQLIQRP